MGIVPGSRPKMGQADVEKILHAKGIDRDKFPVCVLAVRGYYLDTMGVKGKNDRGIFDDAAFVHSPTLFSSVNWNTDPAYYRKGRGTGSSKGIASLKLGTWNYKIGTHKAIYPAGTQAAPVTVVRDGANGDYEDTGWFGINIHPGKIGVSSIGCQTAPKEQWRSFIDPLVAELKRYGQKIFPYVLIDEVERKRLLASDIDEQILLSPALDLIAQFEGLELRAYKDPVGVTTIGYGTIRYPNGTTVKMGDTCTEAQALDWLELHVMETIMPELKTMCQVPLTNNERCALVSFAYNLGTYALKSSTLMRKLNEDRPRAEVAAEFGRWVKAGGRVLAGLVRRRKAERDLFLTA